jgi:hypothetical protein
MPPQIKFEYVQLASCNLNVFRIWRKVIIIIVSYVVYLAITLAVTVWVGRTLSANGRAFLVDAFGSTALADSVNHLLVVGFYLINVGYVCFVLKLDQRPEDVATAIEVLSSKLGLVLLVLGAMHFFNVFLFSRFRKSALLQNLLPPVTPDMHLERR